MDPSLPILRKTFSFWANFNNPLDQNQRELVANNPTCRDKYVQILSNLFKDHKVCGKVAELRHQVNEKTITLHDAISIYEKLDQQITEFMLSAEKRCRKGEIGNVWSIKLVTAARLVRYWKMRRLNQLNNCPADAYLTKLGIDLGIQLCPLTTAAISSQLTKARNSLKTAQSNATQLRNDYLEEMAAQMSEQSNTDIATIIKNIRHRKEIK
eukprot:11417052-Ditylum_brightwellii.AAC.1